MMIIGPFRPKFDDNWTFGDHVLPTTIGAEGYLEGSKLCENDDMWSF